MFHSLEDKNSLFVETQRASGVNIMKCVGELKVLETFEAFEITEEV